MRPLRLVFVAPFALSPKSTTRLRVLPLARALAAAGHTVTVLVPPYDNPAEGGRTFLSGAACVEELRVDSSVREDSVRQAVLQPQLARLASTRALALQPDVVHFFKPKAVSGLAHTLLWGRRLLRRARRPALVLDTDDWEGDGGWNEYEQYPWWQKRACDWQERWGLGHSDAVTAASRTLQAQAWSHRVPPQRVSYVPNGLDPADYPGWSPVGRGETRERLGLGERPVALLYTRFFEFAPGRALEAFGALRERVPDAALLVVGAGKFGQERRLEQLARERGWADAVRLAGWQAPEALPGLIAAADVALFPAEDNLANRAKCSVKVLECMWLGVPVVADRVGQYAEYVAHGETGFLSEPDEPESLGLAAADVLLDTTLRQRLGRRGERRVAEEFNWPRLAAGAERAYRAAIG